MHGPLQASSGQHLYIPIVTSLEWACWASGRHRFEGFVPMYGSLNGSHMHTRVSSGDLHSLSCFHWLAERVHGLGMLPQLCEPHRRINLCALDRRAATHRLGCLLLEAFALLEHSVQLWEQRASWNRGAQDLHIVLELGKGNVHLVQQSLAIVLNLLSSFELILLLLERSFGLTHRDRGACTWPPMHAWRSGRHRCSQTRVRVCVLVRGMMCEPNRTTSAHASTHL